MLAVVLISKFYGQRIRRNVSVNATRDSEIHYHEVDVQNNFPMEHQERSQYHEINLENDIGHSHENVHLHVDPSIVIYRRQNQRSSLPNIRLLTESDFNYDGTYMNPYCGLLPNRDDIQRFNSFDDENRSSVRPVNL